MTSAGTSAGDATASADLANGPRRVGVLVRQNRVAEGLRTAAALPLTDNDVEVILIGNCLPDTPEVALGLDTLDLSDVPVFATFSDSRVSTAEPAELAQRLVGYDHVITF